jgi:hypothetical protein
MPQEISGGVKLPIKTIQLGGSRQLTRSVHAVELGQVGVVEGAFCEACLVTQKVPDRDRNVWVPRTPKWVGQHLAGIRVQG